MRIHLKKNKKKNRVNYYLILVVLIIGIVIYLLNLFNTKALPQLISYSEIEIKKIVSSVINGTVIYETYKDVDRDNLFIMDYDNNGNIINIDFNSSVVNKLLVNTYNAVEKNLYSLEMGDIDNLKLYNFDLKQYNDKLKKGIIYELPSGIILNNVLLNNILPKIPIKIHLIGNTFCRLDTSIKPYGINNALITVNINIEVEAKILLPFVSKNTRIIENVPILMKIIEGSVPSYYFDGFLNSPSIDKNLSNY